MEKKIFRLLISGLCMSLSAMGQTEGYEYQAGISKIQNTGFHNIVLTPAINAYLKTDYSDLRIINSKGKWVPHLLSEAGVTGTVPVGLAEQRILKKNNSDQFTEIVIKTDKSTISGLVIETTNAEVERFCTLTGSDDSTNWYIINDSIPVKPRPYGGGGKSSLNIAFPPNDYRFYKLLIANEGFAPFNIVKVLSSGISRDAGSVSGSYIENPSPAVIQQDSGRFTFVKIIQPAGHHIEKIALKISGVKYFYRKAELFVPGPRSNISNQPGRFLKSFIISNNSDLQFLIPLINADSFFLVIYNEDNPAIKIEEVRTFSNRHTVSAYLEKGENYHLLMCNNGAVHPDYDLPELNLDLSKSLPEATIGPIILIVGGRETSSSSRNNQRMIWLAILVAAIMLGFFTYKLVTEMNKKEKA
jgi:hypothetical protein